MRIAPCDDPGVVNQSRTPLHRGFRPDWPALRLVVVCLTGWDLAVRAAGNGRWGCGGDGGGGWGTGVGVWRARVLVGCAVRLGCLPGVGSGCLCGAGATWSAGEGVGRRGECGCGGACAGRVWLGRQVRVWPVGWVPGAQVGAGRRVFGRQGCCLVVRRGWAACRECVPGACSAVGSIARTAHPDADSRRLPCTATVTVSQPALYGDGDGLSTRPGRHGVGLCRPLRGPRRRVGVPAPFGRYGRLEGGPVRRAGRGAWPQRPRHRLAALRIGLVNRVGAVGIGPVDPVATVGTVPADRAGAAADVPVNGVALSHTFPANRVVPHPSPNTRPPGTPGASTRGDTRQH